MSLTTIYKRPLEVKYKSASCSVAMVFHVLSIATIVIVPALVGFYTRNLWVSDMTYYEQPDVLFKYQMISYLQEKDGTDRVWSTWSYFNTLTQDLLTVPSVSVNELDGDRDGIVDQLNITLQFTESDVVSCKTLLILQYKLSNLVNIVMETPLYFQSTVTEQSVVVWGDLELWQRDPLQPHNTHLQFNLSLIQDPAVLQSYELSKILDKISKRSVGTKLNELYTLSEPAESFTVSYVINIPPQNVRYEPGFWEAVKYAWVQYLALLVVVHYVVSRVRSFVYENMILTTLQHDKMKYN